MFKYNLILVITLLISVSTQAQIAIEWEQNYGTPSTDRMQAAIPANDGNYIIGGYSEVSGAYFDMKVMKISPNGALIWEQDYGGSGKEILNSIIPSSDGGYIIAGSSASQNGDVSNNFGNDDFWIVKIDEDGTLLWEQNYGGSQHESIEDIAETPEGDFIAVGVTASADGQIGGNNGFGDYWIIKVNALGEMLWEKNYGGSSYDWGKSVQVNASGEIMVLGSSMSNDGDVSGNGGAEDFWLIKLDQNGEMLWEQNYPRPLLDHPNDLQATLDGGYVMTGYSHREVFGSTISMDYWIIKVDEEGNVIWENDFGGSQDDFPNSITVTADGGYLINGQCFSNDEFVGNNYGQSDYWVIKLDQNGELIWEQNFGGSGIDIGLSAIDIGADDYLVFGYSDSNDEDVSNNFGEVDFWVLSGWEVQQKITAHAFYDANENMILDDGEEPLFNQAFSLNPNAIIATSNPLGQATFYIDPGNYTLNYAEENPLWDLVDGFAAEDIAINSNTDTTIYFPLIPTAEFTIQSIDVSSSIIRCNQSTNIWVTYANTGTVSTDGVVQLIADSLATFITANPPADSIVGDTLYWFYDNLFPSHSKQIALEFGLPGVDFIGENIDFEAQIQTNEGFGEHKSTLSSELICAYDPNDKLADPSNYGVQNFTLFEDTLEYTIRFQNTGNDTAFNVTIRDTLSEHLNINSFEFIASSHSVRTQILSDEGILEFYFEDIYLPDSFVNEAASHGFLKFSIMGNENLAENTSIQNKAGIFFDQNPPIITNTVDNTMVSELPALAFLATSPNNLTFEAYDIEETEPLSLILNVQNPGDLPLEITAFTIDNPAFFMDEIEVITIQGQGDLSIPVYFQPTIEGDYQSSLIIESSAGDLEIKLYGTGILGTGLNFIENIDFSIYPNPNLGKFLVKVATVNPKTIKIQNAIGETILEQKLIENSINVDLSKQSKGLYFISIETATGISTQKVIVQ